MSKMRQCSSCGGRFMQMRIQSFRMMRELCADCHGRQFPEERAADLEISSDAGRRAVSDVKWMREQAIRDARIEYLEDRIRRSMYSPRDRRARRSMLHWVSSERPLPQEDLA